MSTIAAHGRCENVVETDPNSDWLLGVKITICKTTNTNKSLMEKKYPTVQRMLTEENNLLPLVINRVIRSY